MLKAAMHVHTRNSDGTPTLAGMIEEHYYQNYDILCITDHNNPWHWGLTRNWLSAPWTLTAERFAEIQAGVGRDARPMLEIPLTVELTRFPREHMNTFLVDYNDDYGEGLIRALEEVEAQNGLAHMNHIARDPEPISFYVDLFVRFGNNCVGMEIINQGDRDPDSTNLRIMWDQINTETIPQGRTVWGFSNDDSHIINHVGYGYNVLLTEANTVEAFRTALHDGNFYAVAKIAHNEGVIVDDQSVLPPMIREIAREGRKVQLKADRYDRIVWLADGINDVGSDPEIDLDDLSGHVFVRANIIGPGGIAFTQPIAI